MFTHTYRCRYSLVFVKKNNKKTKNKTKTKQKKIYTQKIHSAENRIYWHQ